MQTYKGGCHCGVVKYEVQGDFNEAISCNCSICQVKGTLLCFAPAANFKLLSGADSLTDYQFGKKRIHHMFCKVCGVTSFAKAKAPNGQEMCAINVRCLADFDIKKIKIKEFDGKSL